MTKIVYDRDDLSVRAEGHSGYGEAGSDIVCSSISAIMYALGSYAVRMHGKEMLTKRPRVSYAPGDAEVSVEARGIYVREARMAFDAMCSALERLSREYPNHVKYEVIYEGI